MSTYFAKEQSLALAQHNNVERSLRTIANKYIGDNPVTPPVFRISQQTGFKRQSDFRYVFDINERFPEAELGATVYAWSKLWFDEAGEACFAANAVGPMTVWLNGQVIYHSNYEEERNPEQKRRFFIPVQAGWNEFVIEFVKTTLGFGGIFGTGRFKNFPFHFIMPLAECDGWEGWAYTAPQASLDLISDFSKWQAFREQANWLPVHQWSEAEAKLAPADRLLTTAEKTTNTLWGWTKITLRSGKLVIKNDNGKAATMWLADEMVQIAAGEVAKEITVSAGSYDLLVNLTGQLTFLQQGKKCQLQCPVTIAGFSDVWLYHKLPLAVKPKPDLTVVQQGNYWLVDIPAGNIRPFLENNRFGKWNYPLGVTLYGLLATARLLKAPELRDYIWEHVNQSTSYYDYSLWDKETYGAAGINNQISQVDSLDDCGSFASLMLELAHDKAVRDCDKIADCTANYIEKKQARLEDGTLVRGAAGLAEMTGTMWADDLYMSIPFLCRYYEKTQDQAIVDDAAQQFLNFRKYLFMPDKKIMSHVYLTDRKLANKIPWGRGNGWVLFSLTELLRVLPKEHQHYQELLAFYQTLCEGYLALQDDEGLWHQVLTDATSYQEASCTAMFVSAMSRGIRNNWLADTEKYIAAVEKGWQGLASKAVDKSGNVYGICQGSGYSFRATYYRNELTWVLNDPHGIGIVLMAGTECLKLRQWLQQNY